VDENALVVELRRRGNTIEQLRAFPVQYRDELIGTLIPDINVDNRVIVDTKVVSAFNESHTAQMVGYLTITSLELALLLNFKFARLEIKRVVRQSASALSV